MSLSLGECQLKSDRIGVKVDSSQIKEAKNLVKREDRGKAQVYAVVVVILSLAVVVGMIRMITAVESW